MGELRCVGVAMFESCVILELQCVGVAVCLSKCAGVAMCRRLVCGCRNMQMLPCCNVWEFKCRAVALWGVVVCGSCSVVVAVFLCGGVAVCGDKGRTKPFFIASLAFFTIFCVFSEKLINSKINCN